MTNSPEIIHLKKLYFYTKYLYIQSLKKKEPELLICKPSDIQGRYCNF